MPVGSRILLTKISSMIPDPTRNSVGSGILLVQIRISQFLLVEIGILICTGFEPVQIRIPISTSTNRNSNLY